MEKEKLSETLVGMVGENSLTDKTWNDYLENTVIPDIPTDESKIEDYLKRHAKTLKSINGQVNHKIATEVNEFKKSYKPEDAVTSNPDNKNPKPENDKLNEIETRLSRFEQEEAIKKTAALKAEKLNEAKKLMKELGASREAVLNLVIPQLNITEDISASDLAKKGKEQYDKAYSDLYGDSYVPVHSSSFAGGSSKQNKDAYMQHLKETGRIKQ